MSGDNVESRLDVEGLGASGNHCRNFKRFAQRGVVFVFELLGVFNFEPRLGVAPAFRVAATEVEVRHAFLVLRHPDADLLAVGSLAALGNTWPSGRKRGSGSIRSVSGSGPFAVSHVSILWLSTPLKSKKTCLPETIKKKHKHPSHTHNKIE